MARMALTRLFSKRLNINYIGLTTITGENHLHTENDSSSALQSTKTQDILLNNIRNATSSHELFSVISNHNQIFNQKHVLQAFTSIHDMYKKNFSRMSTNNLINDPTFERLCASLKKYSRSLNMYELIEALKVLLFLDVSVNTTIVQMLLQLIRKNINDLNLQQIMFLDFVLSRSKTNHLIDSLRLALPLVFQLNLTTQMDAEDINHLSHLLRFCSQNDIPPKLVMSIITSILLCEASINYFTAKTILWSICDMGTPSGPSKVTYAKLLHRCFSIMENDIDRFDIVDIIKTVAKIKDRIVSDSNMEFYNESFLNACGNFVVENKVDIFDALRVSRLFTRINFYHFSLLDYISEISTDENAINEGTSLSTLRPSMLFSFVTSLSHGNHKLKNLPKIKEQLLKNYIFKTSRTTLPWTKFLVELAALDIFDDGVLNNVFSEEFLDDYLSRENNMLDYVQLLTLYQATTLLHPTYNGNIPPKKYLDKAFDILNTKTVDKVLKSALEIAYGGSEYVASGVQMPNGFFVDFIVAFREGHYPIAINLNSKLTTTQFEDLNIPKNAEILCILNFSKGNYCVNCHRMRGVCNLSVNILEAMGFTVVPLSSHYWMSFPEAERIPYLMREINYVSSQSVHQKTGNDLT